MKENKGIRTSSIRTIEGIKTSSIGTSAVPSVDMFYNFKDSNAKPGEPSDWGIHDETRTELPSAQESFRAIICVNGEPYYASIQGRINDPVPTS